MSFFYGVPFRFIRFWPYYHKELTEAMKTLNFEVSGVNLCVVDKGYRFPFLQNTTHEFIYIVTEKHRLQGSDYIGGTEYVFDLEFVKRIKRRND